MKGTPGTRTRENCNFVILCRNRKFILFYFFLLASETLQQIKSLGKTIIV